MKSNLMKRLAILWIGLCIATGAWGQDPETTPPEDPNDLQLNLRAGHALSENLYFLVGWERAFKNDSLSVGVIQKY